MRIAISQPTYLPWLGYFDLISQVDLFVILDNIQFEKQSWQQRNRIKTKTGLQWLTVPVKFRGRSGQLINEVEIRDQNFCDDHVRAIELAYRRAPFFADYFTALAQLLQKYAGRRLIDLNSALLRWLMDALKVTTQLVFASDLGETGKRTELLANICCALEATEYLSPLGSAEYLLTERQILENRGIEIRFQHYEHPEYRQLFPPFLPFASVIDLLFNEGDGAGTILRSGHRESYAADHLLSMANAG